MRFASQEDGLYRRRRGVRANARGSGCRPGRVVLTVRADIELREVRYGQAFAALPAVVPRSEVHARRPGLLEPPRCQPARRRPRALPGRLQAVVIAAVRYLPGIHERLTKSRRCHLPSEPCPPPPTHGRILIMLVLAVRALSRALPITMVIVLLLAIVAFSYRQTIKAYPSGGGAYIVATRTWGRSRDWWRRALMVDYVLTVAVSVAAGVAAVTSAAPGLYDLRVPMRAGGGLFALGYLGDPGIGHAVRRSHLFLHSRDEHDDAWWACQGMTGDAPVAVAWCPPRETVAATQGLTLFLICGHFVGSAALTGVEAISNGVPAFKRRRARMPDHVDGDGCIWVPGAWRFLLASRYGWCRRRKRPSSPCWEGCPGQEPTVLRISSGDGDGAVHGRKYQLADFRGCPLSGKRSVYAAAVRI